MEIIGFLIGITIFLIFHKPIIRMCELFVNFVSKEKYYE